MVKKISGSHIITAFAVIVVGLLVLSVVRGGGGSKAIGHGTGAGETSSSGSFAPDFSLANTNGVGTVSLSDYRGEKPVVLSFWASWCHNCQRNMPVLGRLYEQYKDEVEVIGINLRESPATAQAFISRNEISFPNVVDTGRLAREYGIQYTNTHFLINKESELVRMIPGDVHERDFQALIQ